MSQNIWGGRNLCEGVGGGCPPSHGRELFHFSTWKCAIWGIPKKEISTWRHVLYHNHLYGIENKPWFNFIGPPPPTSTPVHTVMYVRQVHNHSNPHYQYYYYHHHHHHHHHRHHWTPLNPCNYSRLPGETLPPLSPGVLRLYSMAFCPFAERTRLVLAAKGIK